MTKAPKVINTEQILYRAVTDTQFGKLTLSKIPVSDKYFGEYTLEVEAINRLYKTYDDPISKNALILYTKKALSKRNKLTEETEVEIENRVSKIYSLDKEPTYLNDSSIKDAINAWSRQTITVSSIIKLISSGADFSKESTILELQEIAKESLTLSNSIDGFQTMNLFTDDVDTILDEFDSAYQNTVSLGWSELDNYMNGGLSKGEMAMIMAKAGTGKTQTLMNIAKQYILYAKRDVVYFALEEKVSRMVGRLLSLLSNAKMSKLVDFNKKHINYKVDKALLDLFQDRYKKGMLGNFTLAKSTPHTETVASIEQYLVNYGTIHGKMPDVVIIDYPSLLNNKYLAKNVSEYSAEGMMFEQLRGLAERTNTIMWVANQANRMADTVDTVTSFAIEGSKQKLNTVELCISLNQSPKEKTNGFIRFHLDKVRNATNLPEDRMIYMKVNSNSISYENETQTDRDNHIEIVKDISNNMAGKFQTRTDTGNKINSTDVIKRVNQAHQNAMKQYKN